MAEHVSTRRYRTELDSILNFLVDIVSCKPFTERDMVESILLVIQKSMILEKKSLTMREMLDASVVVTHLPLDGKNQ